jgi:ABC-type lipoprotein export system ATPase subunit
MNSGITCRNLSFALPAENGRKRIVLDNITVTFPAGKISVISGSIGAGKSTLLNILAGLIRPTSGEVTVEDKAVSRWAGMHRDLWRRQVGIVFQHYHLLYDYTVIENIMLPLIPLGCSLRECHRKSREALDKVALLHRAGSKINMLSGGERQKTAIARSLVTQPIFLFADEPTAHQDRDNAARVMKLLEQCTKRNAVVIVATHETELKAMSDVPVRYRLDNGTLHSVIS